MENDQSNEKHWQTLVLLLQKIAESKGISQHEIALRTGKKASNISRVFALNTRVTLKTFLSIASAIGVNFFFEDKQGDTDLSKIFEQAMSELGRRGDSLPKN